MSSLGITLVELGYLKLSVNAYSTISSEDWVIDSMLRKLCGLGSSFINPIESSKAVNSAGETLAVTFVTFPGINGTISVIR